MHRIYMTTVNLDIQKLIGEVVKQQKELHEALRAQATNKKILENRAGVIKEEEITLAARRNKELKEQVDILKASIGIVSAQIAEQLKSRIRDSSRGEKQGPSRGCSIGALERSSFRSDLALSARSGAKDKANGKCAGKSGADKGEFAQTLANVLLCFLL